MSHSFFTHGLPSVAVADIDQAETLLGCKLPASYRSFLLQQNGGFCMGYTFPDLVTPVLEFDPAEDGNEIREFYGIEMPERPISLSDWESLYPDLLVRLRNSPQGQNALKLFELVKAKDHEAKALETASVINRHWLPGNLLERAYEPHKKLLASDGLVLPADWLHIGRSKWDDMLFLSTSEAHAGKVYLLHDRDDYFSKFYESYFDAQGQMSDPEHHLIAHDLKSLLDAGVPCPDEEE